MSEPHAGDAPEFRNPTGWRHAPSAPGVRRVSVKFRLTEDEAEALRDRAAGAGVSVSKYVHDAVVDDVPTPLSALPELADAHKRIARALVALNGVARDLEHAGEHSAPRPDLATRANECVVELREAYRLAQSGLASAAGVAERE